MTISANPVALREYHESCYPQDRLDASKKLMVEKTALYALSIIAFIILIAAAIVLTSIFSPIFVSVAILGGSIGLPLLFGLALDKVQADMTTAKKSIDTEQSILYEAVNISNNRTLEATKKLNLVVADDPKAATLYFEYQLENLKGQLSAKMNEINESMQNGNASQLPRLIEEQNALQNQINALKPLEVSTYDELKAPLLIKLQKDLESANAFARSPVEVKNLHSRIVILDKRIKYLVDSEDSSFLKEMKIVNLTLRKTYLQTVLRDPTCKIRKFEEMYTLCYKNYTPDQMNQMINGTIPYCTTKSGEEETQMHFWPTLRQ